MMAERPGTDLLIHPECGCASQCMYAAAHDRTLASTTHVLSTEGMVRHVAASPKRDFVVATETGILYRLRKEAPDKRFYAMSERAVCRYMKQITLPKLRDSLRDLRHEVRVDPEVADRARLAIERMVEIA
jgi:quinolinate synthase